MIFGTAIYQYVSLLRLISESSRSRCDVLLTSMSNEWSLTVSRWEDVLLLLRPLAEPHTYEKRDHIDLSSVSHTGPQETPQPHRHIVPS